MERPDDGFDVGWALKIPVRLNIQPASDPPSPRYCARRVDNELRTILVDPDNLRIRGYTVGDGERCPYCRENQVDRLIMNEDRSVECLSCDRTYRLGWKVVGEYTAEGPWKCNRCGRRNTWRSS